MNRATILAICGAFAALAANAAAANTLVACAGQSNPTALFFDCAKTAGAPPDLTKPLFAAAGQLLAQVSSAKPDTAADTSAQGGAVTAADALCSQVKNFPDKVAGCTAVLSDASLSATQRAIALGRRAVGQNWLQNKQEARRDAEMSIKLAPTVLAYVVLADLDAHFDVAAAIKDIEMALALEPGNSTAISAGFRLVQADAFVTYKYGPRDLAVAKFKTLQNYDPDDANHTSKWLKAASDGSIVITGTKYTMHDGSFTSSVTFQ